MIFELFAPRPPPPPSSSLLLLTNVNRKKLFLQANGASRLFTRSTSLYLLFPRWPRSRRALCALRASRRGQVRMN